MVQLIIGEKGKGKTKHLLEKVNSEIQKISGNIVYLDKSTKHMYELNNKVRLIDVSDYFIDNYSEFIGFILGILSQDHDLEQMYIDSFLIVSKCDKDFEYCIDKLEKVSEAFKTDFIICASVTEDDISAETKKKVILSL